MKKSCLFCKGFWPFLLLPFLLLLLAVMFDWRDIESDVAKNANTDLNANGFNTVETNTHSRGRELELKGSAANQEDVDAMLNIAKQSEGVRTVTWQGEISDVTGNVANNVTTTASNVIEPVTMIPSSLRLTRTGQGIELAGTTAKQTVAPDVLTMLSTKFGSGNVTNKLTLSDQTKPVSGFVDIAELLLELPEGAQINIDNNVLTLSGTVASLGKKKIAGNKAKSVFDGDVRNELAVQLQVIDSANLVSINECQRLFNQLTSQTSVNFKTGSAIALSDSYLLLDQFTELTRRCPSAIFEVSGHTDSMGNAELNNNLSQARAEAVMNHIVNSGVDKSRFTAKGYGSSKPIADNQTEEGRARNRRVEFNITNK